MHRARRSAARAARSAPGSTCPPCRRRRRRWAPARRRARSSAMPRKRAHLAAVVEDALALRVERAACRRASGSASAHSGSRKRCSMRWVRQVPRDHVRARGERARRRRRAGSPSARAGCRACGLTRGAPGASERRRVEHRREHLVVDLDQRGRARARCARRRRRRRRDVADAARLLADGDEAGPVGVDQAVPALARDVGGGDHGAHARAARGPRRRRCASTRARGCGESSDARRAACPGASGRRRRARSPSASSAPW